MTTQIEAIQAEITQLETRGYAKLERWERARLTDLRIQLRNLDPVVISAKQAAENKRRVRSAALLRRSVYDLADAMGEHGEGVLDIARKHGIKV